MRYINVNLDEEIDLEKIAEDGLPVTINGEVVMYDFDSYIEIIKIIDPEKAENILREIEEFEKTK